MLTVTGETRTGCLIVETRKFFFSLGGNAAFELKPTIVGVGDETTEQFGLRFIAVSR